MGQRLQNPNVQRVIQPLLTISSQQWIKLSSLFPNRCSRTILQPWASVVISLATKPTNPQPCRHFGHLPDVGPTVCAYRETSLCWPSQTTNGCLDVLSTLNGLMGSLICYCSLSATWPSITDRARKRLNNGMFTFNISLDYFPCFLRFLFPRWVFFNPFWPAGFNVVTSIGVLTVEWYILHPFVCMFSPFTASVF